MLEKFVSFRLTPETRAHLRAHANDLGIPPTAFVRQLVERELAKHQPTAAPPRRNPHKQKQGVNRA